MAVTRYCSCSPGMCSGKIASGGCKWRSRREACRREHQMGGVVPFGPGPWRKHVSPQGLEPRMPYETYAAYHKAQAIFRALYLGRSIDTVNLEDSPSALIVRRHWAVVDRLAQGLLVKGSLSREHALRLQLRPVSMSRLRHVMSTIRNCMPPAGKRHTVGGKVSLDPTQSAPALEQVGATCWRLDLVPPDPRALDTINIGEPPAPGTRVSIPG
jgi:hypothetical protein